MVEASQGSGEEEVVLVLRLRRQAYERLRRLLEKLEKPVEG